MNLVEHVPSDVWIEIFMHCCIYDAEDEARTGIYPSLLPLSPEVVVKPCITPFTLSHVCRRFRQIVTSQNILWTRITIHPTMNNPSTLLDHWLMQSGTFLPLSISIENDQSFQFSPPGTLSTILLMLRSVAPRWKKFRFNLNINNQSWAEFCANLNFSGVPSPSSLETLVLGPCTWETDASDISTSRIDAVQHFLSQFVSPRLRAIKIGDISPTHLRNVQYPTRTLIFLPNLSNAQLVTSIVLVNQMITSIGRLFENLSQLNHLEVLEIRRCLTRTASDDFSVNRRFNFPALKVLTLVDWDHNYVILNNMLLPALEDAVLQPCTDTNSLYCNLVQSKCPLRRLRLQISDKQARNRLHHIFLSRSLSGLEELTLETYDPAGRSGSSRFSYLMNMERLDNQYLTLLASLDLPHLGFNPTRFPERVNLIGCTCDDGHLAKLANARVLSGSVKYLRAEIWNTMGEHVEDMKVFKELKDQGFDVELTFAAPPSSMNSQNP